MIVGGCVKVVAKARQPSSVQLRDIDGDVMMTTASVTSRSSPNRHSRSSSAPTVTQSPLHGSEVRGSKSHRARKQREEEQFDNFADFSSFEPERDIERNPMHVQQLSQNHHNRTPISSSSLTSSSTIPSSSQKMKKEEVEDVFDFRFDDLLNEKVSDSSKYSKGLTSNDDENIDYDLDGGDDDDDYSKRRKPSSSTFSFFSTFSSHGSKGGKKKSKDKVDYESLVL